eukprot:3151879-Amphidinium_carterae.3
MEHTGVTVFLKCVEATASWPLDLRELLYLQLPTEGAKNAACCIADVLAWRQPCKDRGETLAGQGALDETFDLAYLTEEHIVLLGSTRLVFSWTAVNATSGFRSVKNSPLRAVIHFTP